MDILDAASVSAQLRATDFSGRRATLIGYGNMGKQYYQALRALGVRHIRVCACHEASLQDLRGVDGVELFSEGLEGFREQAAADEVAILAIPIDLLVPGALQLADQGFRSLLIEKPIALDAATIGELAATLDARHVRAMCAYNRGVYPSVIEVRARAEREGGITSCTYVFTEMIKPDWPQRFSATELARWGVANSLHVMSLAHSLIGWPAEVSSVRTGAIDWHPTGAVFAGGGLSQRGIPFSYHADWLAKGRWVVEVHTRESSYRLAPLEKVLRRVTATGEWEPVEVAAFDPAIKAGIVEEVAIMLGALPELASLLPDVRQTAELTAYGEQVFGYA